MVFSDFIYIFGSIGIFIYGMILLSDSLEKAAGNKLKNIISTMTNNRFMGLFTGFFVTSVIQSSSATTVMVVSFVNAGLLNLGQAIGVIMGANIGTTITAWLINLTNLKIDMNFVAFCAIILGVVLMFIKGKKWSLWGYTLLGFGFLFIGLHLLTNAVPKPTGLNEGNLLYDFFNWIPKDSYWTLFIFVLIGTALTMIVQSSSVMMAFTITIAGQGYIDFYHAAAMVLGENIGTTITAILASLPGNKMAKKAAMAHCMFNVIGVCWMMTPFMFNLYIDICQKLGGGIPGVELAIFHSTFNISNALFLIWFVPQIEKILNYKKEPVRFSLLNMDKGIIKTPDLALFEVSKEIEKLTLTIEKNLNTTNKLLTDAEHKDNIFSKIKEIREETVEHETVIINFLNSMMTSNISGNIAEDINKLTLHTKMLSNISRQCEKISLLVKDSEMTNFNVFIKNDDEIGKFLKKINTLFNYVKKLPENTESEILILSSHAEDEIDKYYWKMKKHTVSVMKKKHGKSIVSNGLIFLEIIKTIESIGDDLQKIISINSEIDQVV